MSKGCRNISLATMNCVDICQGENLFSHCYISTQIRLGIYDYHTLNLITERLKKLTHAVYHHITIRLDLCSSVLMS